MTAAAAIVSIIVGMVMIYFVNRRKFNRRTFTGIEAFSSYEASVATRFTEYVVKLIAIGLILFGIFLAAVAFSIA